VRESGQILTEANTILESGGKCPRAIAANIRAEISMSTTIDRPAAGVAAIPDYIGNADPTYRPYPKLVGARPNLVLRDAYLKWYDISRAGVALEPLAVESREFLIAESEDGRLALENRLGFLELHHCTSVAFLIVCTWNNDNELWQTVYVKDLATSAPYERVTREAAGHRPIFCVWELAPVWHEREAWMRYVSSARDAIAKTVYVNDRFAGVC